MLLQRSERWNRSRQALVPSPLRAHSIGDRPHRPHRDLSTIGQKRGLTIVIYLKTGLESWLPDEKIGTFMTGKDIFTPEVYRITQIHDDEDLTQSQPSSNKGYRVPVRNNENSRRKNLDKEFTTELKDGVDSRLQSLERCVSSLDSKHDKSLRLMMLMARNNGVPEDKLAAAIEVSDSEDDNPLFPHDPIDLDIDDDRDGSKRKWCEDTTSQTSAAELPVDALRTEACATFPQGAAQILRLRSRAELIWVLGQIFKDGLFTYMSNKTAKKAKMQPVLTADDNIIVVAVRVASRANTEGCIIVRPAEPRKEKIAWPIPAWKENMGLEVSLQRIFGNSQAALKAARDSVLLGSPHDRSAEEETATSEINNDAFTTKHCCHVTPQCA